MPIVKRELTLQDIKFRLIIHKYLSDINAVSIYGELDGFGRIEGGFVKLLPNCLAKDSLGSEGCIEQQNVILGKFQDKLDEMWRLCTVYEYPDIEYSFS